MDYPKIDKDIESSVKKKRVVAEIAEKMQVGDSVLVNSFVEANYYMRALRAIDKRPSYRKDKETEGFRVWVVESALK